MASVIKLKRSLTPGSVPSSLQEGELAANLEDLKLYIGGKNGSANVQSISGDQYNLTSTNGSDEVTITLTVDNDNLANDSIVFSAGEGVDISESGGTITISGEDATTSNKGIASFNTDDFDVSSGAVDLKGTVVKTVSGDSGSATPSTHGFTISGDDTQGIDTSATGSTVTVTAKDATSSQKGVASFSSDDFDVSSGAVTIKNDGVTLGTQTTGNYVATVADAGDGNIIVSGSGSETAAVTLDLADTINSNTSGVAAQADALTSAVTVTLTGDVSGTATFTNAGDTASISTTIQANSVELGADTTGNYVAGISGTANEIEVSGSGSEDATVTIGLPDDVTVGNDLTVSNDLSVGGALTVDGNLTVEGALTYLSTQTLQVDDNNVVLASNNAADTVDTGVYGRYVVSGNSAVQFAGYFRDATDGVFKFFTGLDDEPGATVNTSDTGYGLAQVDAIIDGGTY